MTLGKTRNNIPWTKLKPLTRQGSSYMSYWTDRNFDEPLEKGEKKCEAEKIFVCFESIQRNPKKTTTNLGGVLGVEVKNSVPNNFEFGITKSQIKDNKEVMKNQISLMDWDDELILAAMYLFRKKGYKSLIRYIPDFFNENQIRRFSKTTLRLLNLNKNIKIYWSGGIVNGTLSLTSKKNEPIMSSYINFRYNSLAFDRPDQTAVLNYLSENGGRFLQTYIGRPEK